MRYSVSKWLYPFIWHSRFFSHNLYVYEVQHEVLRYRYMNIHMSVGLPVCCLGTAGPWTANCQSHAPDRSLAPADLETELKFSPMGNSAPFFTSSQISENHGNQNTLTVKEEGNTTVSLTTRRRHFFRLPKDKVYSFPEKTEWKERKACT